MMSLVLHGDLLSSAPSIHLLLYIRSVFEVLLEVADVAVYGLPGFEGEGDDGDL